MYTRYCSSAQPSIYAAALVLYVVCKVCDSGRVGVRAVCSSSLQSLGVLALEDAFSDW